MNSNEAESELVREFKKGNTKAFEKLFEIYHKKLYGFIFSFTRSREDSEEIVQNAFFQVWKHRDNFKEEHPFEAYLFRIARNAFLNHNRKQINRRVFEKHALLYTRTEAESADEYILFNETKKIVENLINSMPPKRREIFILQKVEGLSRKEISEKLNLSVVTVDSHLMAANRQFTQGLRKLNLMMLNILFC
ncbi:MAG: RNA polymerase sigma factor [Mangrovibacterium sp.]